MKRTLTTLLLMTLALAAAEGRVFQRWKAAAAPAGTMENLGGTPVYTAPMQINGGAAHVTVHAFANGLADTWHAIEAAFGAGGTSGPGMARLELRDGSNVIRLLGLSFQNDRQTVVIMIQQDEREADRSAPSLTESTVQAPLFPGGRLLFTARNGDTGLAAARWECPAAAPAVRQFYDEGLSRQGWQPVIPFGTAPQSAMAVYVRDNRTCIVHVAVPAESPATSQVTVLEKQQGTGGAP